MAKFKNEITQIETGSGKSGPYKLLHIKGKDKPKKVWGEVAKVFTGPGLYEVENIKNEETGFWELKSARLLGESSGGGGNEPSRSASLSDASRSRSIQAQTSMKAAAEVLQGYAASGMALGDIVGSIEPLMTAFFNASDKLSGPEAGA
jgi:hypothetical protein